MTNSLQQSPPLRVHFCPGSKDTVFQDFTETEVSLLLHRSPEPKDECNNSNILEISSK